MSVTETVTYGEAGIPNVTPETFWDQKEEFRDLQLNLIKIHVVSEDYGADCFEPSILRAPTPEAKMRMATTVAEEYGHHLRFRALLDELGLDWREFSADKDHLTTFDTPIDNWADQVVFLALVDRAAAHQFRQFVKSPYAPFRHACRDTLNEEYGHVGFGMDGVKDMLETPEGRAAVEAAVPKWLRVGLASFGSDRSRTNDRYRYWGFKSETNAAMRAAYYRQVRAFAARDWGIELAEEPAVYMAAADEMSRPGPAAAG